MASGETRRITPQPGTANGETRRAAPGPGGRKPKRRKSRNADKEVAL